MNPLAFFLPGQRASTSTFFIGLVVLAALDAGRIWALQQDFLPEESLISIVVVFGSLLLMMLFVLFLFMNRRKDAERGAGLAFLPVGISLLIRVIAAGVFVTYLGISLAGQFAESQGQDFATAAQDPAFNEQFQAWMADNPDADNGLSQISAFVSFFGFWIPVFLFAPWFGGMKPETE